MKESIQKKIENYLKSKGSFVYGGTVELEVSGIAQCKPSHVSRQLRKLCQLGVIESQYIQNPNGSGNRVVQYRASVDNSDQLAML